MFLFLKSSSKFLSKRVPVTQFPPVKLKMTFFPVLGGMKVKVKVAQSCLTLCNPMDYTAHGILQARILEWVAVPSSRGLPNPGIKPRSPELWADSLSPEPPGKPENTQVGSLSLLQGIFLTQELNWGILHCR